MANIGDAMPNLRMKYVPIARSASRHRHNQGWQKEQKISNSKQLSVVNTRISCTSLPLLYTLGLLSKQRTILVNGQTKKKAILSQVKGGYLDRKRIVQVIITVIGWGKFLNIMIFIIIGLSLQTTIIEVCRYQLMVCHAQFQNRRQKQNQLQLNLQLMLYPPKKRAYSPEAKKTKDLANLPNINSKFTGSGGNTSSLAPKKQMSVPKPAVSGIFAAEKKMLSQPTLFRKYYERGDLPVAVSFNGALRKLTWKMEPEHLDYHLHLPIFFQGIRQVQEPYKFLACQGVDEMIERNPNKLLPVLPQLIIPIKKALSTKDHEVMCIALKKIQKLVLAGQMIGQALVPYYRQILPVFNMFKNKRLNIGDKIDYGQRKNENLSDLIQETLEVLEKHGGEDAYINIKYMIPTYESCMF